MPFNIDEVFSKLTNNEKTALLSGSDFWHTAPLPAHSVPPIRCTDGPNGVRGTRFFGGIPACCLPCGTALGSTWDRSLLNQAGALLAAECIVKGAHVWLGPTINIQRSPLGGRGFESFAEDPFLSGVLAAEMIKGCESLGVSACVKHFVANDMEHERRAVDVRVTERALREVYLKPFQIVARDARPKALMTAYNKVNGGHVSQDRRLLEGVVRGEWGWDPLVMSDWYGTYSTAEAINAGLNLEMPGKSRYRGNYVDFAVSARLVHQSMLDARAKKVLEFVEHASRLEVLKEEGGRDFPEDRALNRRICAESIVLLKNDDSILPLPKKIKKLALIGSHMKLPAVSGGGSAALKPYYTVSLHDAIQEKLASTDVEIIYEVGAYAHKMLPVIERMLSNAVINFYNEPASVKDREWLGNEPLDSMYWQLMDYNKLPKLNMTLFYASVEADFTPDASGVWDFGLAVFGTANLYIDDELVIDNSSVQRKGDAFFGKATVEEMGSKELKAGQTYKLRVEFGSANTSKTKDVGVVSFGGGAARLGAALRVDIQESIDKAAKAAAEAEYAVLCTGLNADWESEGFDRKHMDLPPYIDSLISRVLAANPQTIIVNQSGTPVTMPWASSAACIVQAWYGGNETGNGIADVLFGDVNPSGKLSLSWPKDVRDNPAYLSFESVNGRVLYGEDVYVGYKYYDRTGRETLFPFGHGLSYTSFAVSELKVTRSRASMKVKNTGRQAGAQVLQLYVSAPGSVVARPVKEFHGFEKVFLQPGEEKQVDIAIDKYATSLWDEIENKWKSEAGIYEVLIGASSTKILAKGEFELKETGYWLGL